MRKIGVLLVNLGTPDSPTRAGLKKYLNQFLTDRRVIDLPAVPRSIIFKGIVVPIRSGKVAKLYEELWIDEGSPLKVYGEKLADQVQQQLGDEYLVRLAMRYQSPSIKDEIDYMYSQHVSELLVLPLFPQYASATTGSVFEEVMNVLRKKEQIPTLKLLNSYFDHPSMVEIFVENAKKYTLDDYDHIIFSFHGVPRRYLKKENDYCEGGGECCQRLVPENQFCYAAQCQGTAKAIADALQLDPSQFTVAYQSRFGPEEWIKPYTDEVMFEQLEKGNKKILVFSPAFVADCLETTIEIGLEYKEEFIEKGGERLDLVESLNVNPKWVDTVADIISKNTQYHAPKLKV